MSNSMEQTDNNSRRMALKTLIKGVGAACVGGIAWAGVIAEAKSTELILRPPGALDEKDFLKACIKCGACVEACPYDTLRLASLKEEETIGTPYYVPREIPCYMCTDVHCVPACPSNALDITKVSRKLDSGEAKLDINLAKMGIAVIDTETCLAYWGIQCDACYRACPVMDKAIVLEYERNEVTGRHALIKPKIKGDACTGCGICEHACVTKQASVRVLPRNVVMGEAGDHYVKGWDASDEKRIQGNGTEQGKADGTVPAADYLNNWEDLLDDE